MDACKRKAVFRTATAIAFFSAFAAFASPCDASDAPRNPVKAKLAPFELPLSSFGAITAAKGFPSEQTSPPQGYDCCWKVLLCGRQDSKGKESGGIQCVFLRKGWDYGTFKLFYMPEGGRPQELQRIEKGINEYYVPFGPVKLPVPKLPPVLVHVYFPPRNVEAFRNSTSPKQLYLTPCECLAAEAEIGGARRRLGLLDRTLNGGCLDLCRESVSDGDWVLIDDNGDGSFAISGSGPESRPLTRAVAIGGSYWAVSIAGTDLVLKPVPVPVFRLRVDGVRKPCKIFGWSDLTGNFAADLDEACSAEIPKDAFQLWSYDWTSGNFSLNGSLRSTGRQKPPSGGEQRISIGPLLKGTLEKQNEGRNIKFLFTCKGRGGESVNIDKDGKRQVPKIVIRRQDGTEVARLECPFG